METIMILGDGVRAMAYTEDSGAFALNVRLDTVSHQRQWVRWSIHVNGRLLSSAADISGPVGGIDAREAMGTLLAFLTNDADRYRRHMGPVPEGEDDYAFGEAVAEWAYGESEHLEMAALEIEPMEQEAASHKIEEDPCDECGARIPDDVPSEVNDHHADTCSLYSGNLQD